MFKILLLAVFVTAAYAASRTCNGDITKLSPTGKKSGGVSASNSAVSSDLSRLNNYKDCMQRMADKYCIQASVIGAIASRESNAGATLTSDGYDVGRNAYGLMQCDIKNSGLPCLSCLWNSCCHIEMMVSRKLVPEVAAVQRKTGWSKDRSLQGAVAAYNFGLSNVRTWSGLDVGTTHGDYSNDVIARAKYLYSKGWN